MHAKCSWFYISLCRAADIVRSYMWINIYNPNNTSFLNDPWCFEISLVLRFTFLNMDFGLQSLRRSNFISDSKWKWEQWNWELLGLFFCPYSDPSIRNMGTVDVGGDNH